MAIEFQCKSCGCVLRVGDETAGKRARCPECQIINDIPAASAPQESIFDEPTIAPTSQPEQFFIDSVSGKSYGPVNRTQLDEWAAQGRISAQCKIRPVGSAAVPATTYYPSLLNGNSPAPQPAPPQKQSLFDSLDQKTTSPFQGQASANPYATPTQQSYSRPQHSGPAIDGPINPVAVDFGELFSASWDIFKAHFGLMVLFSITLIAISVVDSGIREFAEGAPGDVRLMLSGAVILINLVQIFLTIGFVQAMLKMCRGQNASFADLFGGGERMLSVLGFVILSAVCLVIALLMLVIPFFILLVLYWPTYYLIVDSKGTVSESIGLAFQLGKRNVGTTLLLGLTSFGLTVAGFLAFCVGYIFVLGFVGIMWTVGYLMMSGQMGVRR